MSTLFELMNPAFGSGSQPKMSQLHIATILRIILRTPSHGNNISRRSGWSLLEIIIRKNMLKVKPVQIYFQTRDDLFLAC